MRRTRLGAAALALLLAATVGAAVTHSTGYAQTVSPGCGSARWDVKTLGDRPKLNPEWKAATVDELGAGMKYGLGPATRGDTLPRQTGFKRVEFTIFRVDARLVGWKRSGDGDIHFVIRDIDKQTTLIAEFPKDACVPETTRKGDRTKMAAARAAIEEGCGSVTLSSTWRTLSGTIRLVGVGFWDKNHGQKEPAPNRIELHPVLSATRIHCAKG